jgi:general secretion pathway protein F
MPEFLYKATTPSGQTIEGFMEGRDEGTIVESLHRFGYIPIRIQTVEKKEPILTLSSFLPKRVSTRDLLVFTQELSTLVAAGLPIDRSLGILGELTENARLRKAIREVLKRVEGGSSLAEALEAHPKIFPKLYVNMVRAGEVGGFLDSVLLRLSHYLQSLKEIREALLSVMIYPLILTFVSGISITILVTFVVPRFARIFSDIGQAIPMPTQIVLTISHFVRNYWWIGAGFILLLYFLFKVYTRNEENKLHWDQFKLKWFILGDLFQKMEVARFARTLGTLLQSGVSILSALDLVREISQNRVISKAIGYLHDRLREGKGISKSLNETTVFPPLAVHMIGVGEETGRLDEMLLRVAEVYEENVRNSMRRLISLIEPIIILIMGGLVGFIVISMLLAIFSINEIPF